MSRMLDFRERSKLRKAIYAKPTILILVALVIISAHGAFGMYQKSQEAAAKRDKVEEALVEEKAREAALQADIARLSTERGQEEEIRDRFMVARDGEKVIIITPSEVDKVHTVTVSESPADPTMMDKFKATVGISGE